jgi:hypothetical protein
MLGESDGSHIFSCPCLGGQIYPHDEVKFVLAHLMRQSGATSTVPLTEVLVQLRSGGEWYADIQYMDQFTGQTFVIDVSIVNTDSASEVRRGGGATGSVDEALRRREREKRALPAARDIIDQEGPQTCFNPFVMSSSGGFGPAARAFLKTLYATARRTGHWVMASGQPQIDVTWNTLFASDYWNMRLSMACTVTSAEVVGKLLVRDFSKDLVTHPERRQAPRDPNFSAVGWESLAVGWDGGSAV